MPNSNFVDERVVQMRMDNEDFEKGAAKTMGTLEKLKTSLNFKNNKNNIGDLGTSTIEESLDKIQQKFGVLQIAGKRLVENVTDSVVNLAKQAITGADQIRPGYAKYEQQIEAVQKLMNATGETMEVVQEMSDKILWFTDETSYNYSSMLDTMASFTSSGMGVKDAMNTILGLAVAAGQSGVSAQNASHAFQGFQKAIGQGYMSSATWQWIKTAGMNAAELKEVLLEAAVATGDLEKSQDGLYYALEETAKGVKRTEVSVQNFDQSFATKWLSDEAIVLGMQKYVKAVNQIYDIHQKTGQEMYEIIAGNSEYLGQIDKYSLEAFKAGQETKTWSDAMNALKSAVSSGWMKSFELIIGNYKQASEFFTELIEPLWGIFVNPGGRRNSLFEAIFGGADESSAAGKATTKTVANWNKLEKKLTETGHTVDELESAFKKVVSSSQDAKVKALASEYDTLEAAIRSGAISGDLLLQILNEINGVTATSTNEVASGSVDATEALEKYKEVARQVLRGDFGNGDKRRQALEELGYDYDMIQWLAGNLQEYGDFDWEWIKSVAPNHYEQFMKIIGEGNVVLDTATGEWIILGDVVDEVTDEIGDQMEEMTGRELWQGGVLNIVRGIAAVFDQIGKAIDRVFGTVEERAKGFRGLLQKFYRATTKINIEDNEDALMRFQNFFVKVFEILKAIPNAVSKVVKVLKNVKDVAFALVDKFLSLFTGSKDISHKFGTLGSILEKIKIILSPIIRLISEVFGSLGKNTSDIVSKIQNFKLSDLFGNRESGSGFFNGIVESFNNLTGENGVFSAISRFFTGFKKDKAEVDESIQGVSDGLTRLGAAFNVVDELTKGIDDEDTLRARISKMWENFKKIVVEQYKLINWDTLKEVGRIGLLTVIILRLNAFFKSLTDIMKVPKGISGLLKSISLPFITLSRAITEQAKSDRYLKIAMAIGILAGSIYLLAKVPVEDFYNVVTALAFLMLIMSRLAKNAQGFQLFSNNNKTISKDNPITNTIKAFEQLKTAFSVDLSHAKATVNVFSNIAQILIGTAVLIAALIYAFNQIRDIESLEEVKPTLIILGGTLIAVLAFIAIASFVSKKAEHLGAAALVLISAAGSIVWIMKSIEEVGKLSRDDLDWTAMLVMLGMMVVVIFGITRVLSAASGMVKQGQSMITSGSAVWGIAGVMLSLAVMIRSLVKTMVTASEIENLWQAVGVLAGLLIAMGVVFYLMSRLVSSNIEGAGGMIKIAASMAILAAALWILVPAIALMSALPAAGLISAAVALGILVLAISGAMSIMDGVDSKKMIGVAAAFVLIAVGIGILCTMVLALNFAMIAMVSVVPWETLLGRFESFKEAMKTILPSLWQLSIIAVIAGVGLALMGIGVGVVGLGFLAAAAGIFLGALALKTFGDALTSIGNGLPTFVEGLVRFYDVVDQNGWKVIVMIVALVAAVLLARKLIGSLNFAALGDKVKMSVPNLISGIGNIIKAIQLLAPAILKLIASFVPQILTVLILMIPLLSKKVIQILVTFISSLADAIRSNSGAIIAAFSKFFGELLGLAAKSLTTFIGDIAIFLRTLIAESARAMGGKIGNKIADFVDNHLWPEDKIAEKADEIGKVIDTAVDKSFGRHNVDLNLEITASETNIDISDIEDDPELLALLDEYEQGMAESGAEAADTLVAATAAEINTEENQQQVSAAVQDLATQSAEDDLSIEIPLSGFSFDTSNLSASSFIGGIQDLIGSEDSIGSMQSSFGGLFTSVFSDNAFLGSLSGSATSGGQTVLNGLTDFFTSEDSQAQMGGAASNVFDYFSSQYDTDVTADTPILGNNTIAGLYNSIVSNAESLMPDAGSYAFSQFKTGYENASLIASPSKKMEEEGVFTVLGLAQGLLKNAHIAEEAGGSVGDSVIDEFRETLADIAIIADDDFSVSPVITPVVDMSNVDTAVNSMSGQIKLAVGAQTSEHDRFAVMQGVRDDVNQKGLNALAAQVKEQNDTADSLWNNYAMRVEEVGSTFDQRISASGLPDEIDSISSKVDSIGNAIDELIPNITVNVYGAPGQDPNALADAVMNKMQNLAVRRGAAYG